MLKWAVGVTVALAAAALVGSLTFGSLDAAVARLRGEFLAVSPAAVDFGGGKPGELLSTTVKVRNFSDAPVRLIGGTSDCSCIVTQDFPVTVPPRESADITLKMKVPSESTGQMSRTLEVHTDCPNHRTIRLTAGCRVE